MRGSALDLRVRNAGSIAFCATIVVVTRWTTKLMICDEKARLTKEYKLATAEFSEAVAELQRTIGTSTKVKYERLQRASDEARRIRASTSVPGAALGSPWLLKGRRSHGVAATLLTGVRLRCAKGG
jgi:hypothetical protein